MATLSAGRRQNGATNPLETLATILADEMSAVNDLIHQRMQSENAPRIPEVTAHLVGAGGKRVRPLLTIAAARLCNYQGEHHIGLATTVEFIHTATLLHDDVVDESRKRRGRPTANLLWDNKSSVLVGDYLFSRSFQLMVDTGSLEVLRILSNASAVIAEGEVLQLSVSRDVNVDEATYFRVIEGKTAALFAAATEVGGVIADARANEIESLREYGMKLGLAFQIADDILDYTAGEGFGKALGNDFHERKMTLPVIRAVANANDADRQFWERVIRKGEQNEGDLAHAIKLMIKAKALQSSRDTALKLAADARMALDVFPNSQIKTVLGELADYVVRRLV